MPCGASLRDCAWEKRKAGAKGGHTYIRTVHDHKWDKGNGETVLTICLCSKTNMPHGSVDGDHVFLEKRSPMVGALAY